MRIKRQFLLSTRFVDEALSQAYKFLCRQCVDGRLSRNGKIKHTMEERKRHRSISRLKLSIQGKASLSS